MIARTLALAAPLVLWAAGAFAQLNSYEQGRRQLGDDLMQQHDEWERRRKSAPSGSTHPNSPPVRIIYGAIALSPTTGALGWSHGQDSQKSAEAFAVSQCAQHSDDCERMVSWGNGCGTLAMGDKNFVYAVSIANSQEQAEREAVANCNKKSRDCRPIRTVCTK
jgi:serine/threonine-protein kinase